MEDPVSKSQLIVLPFRVTFNRGRSLTPLKGFIKSEILLTVAMDKAHKEKISLGIIAGAFVRGVTRLRIENPAFEQCCRLLDGPLEFHLHF